MQWHPIFACLLRPLLQNYYDVQTDVPVGDLPRQADIVLLRRISPEPPPFVGIWRHLTTWNVLEFKGPTDDPALRDLDLLLEVALGIDRRLNDERRQQGQTWLERPEVSFWYLANHVGQRFRAEAEHLAGQPLQPLADGLWRCPIVGRSLVVVSRDTLPVERDSIPLHLVTEEPIERERALAQQVAQQAGLWREYASWLAFLHPNVWEEAQLMIRSLGTEPTLDLRPLIQMVGLRQVIDQIGVKEVIDQVGLREVLTSVGPEQVIQEMGVEWLVSNLTPEQIQELKRRLP